MPNMANSNDPSQASTDQYVGGVGLPYTGSLAENSLCQYVYVETARFTFTRKKAPANTSAPATFTDMLGVQNFMRDNAGVLIVFQDGTADWNFRV